jgi:hypothetical protein
MNSIIKAASIALLCATFFCAVVRGQDMPQDPSKTTTPPTTTVVASPTPPAPLTMDDKLAFTSIRADILTIAVTEDSINRDAEKAMREARDKIMQDREQRLAQLKTDRDVKLSKFTELHDSKRLPGWKLNVPTLTWEKEAVPTAPATTTVGPTVASK